MWSEKFWLSKKTIFIFSPKNFCFQKNFFSKTIFVSNKSFIFKKNFFKNFLKYNCLLNKSFFKKKVYLIKNLYLKKTFLKTVLLKKESVFETKLFLGKMLFLKKKSFWNFFDKSFFFKNFASKICDGPAWRKTCKKKTNKRSASALVWLHRRRVLGSCKQASGIKKNLTLVLSLSIWTSGNFNHWKFPWKWSTLRCVLTLSCCSATIHSLKSLSGLSAQKFLGYWLLFDRNNSLLRYIVSAIIISHDRVADK